MSHSFRRAIIRRDGDEKSVSSIIGTILMISITVVLIATVAVYAESYIQNLPPPPPSVTLIVMNESTPSGYYYNITFRTVSSPINLYDIELQFNGPSGYSNIPLRSGVSNFTEGGFTIQYRNNNLFTTFTDFTKINTSLDIEFKSTNNASSYFFYNVNVIDMAINKVIGSGYPQRTV
ncbi:MAG: type IV pilin [Thermoplasmataceae archaeon]